MSDEEKKTEIVDDNNAEKLKDSEKVKASEPAPGGDAFQNPPDERLIEILKSARNIAVVGLTPDPKTPANRVARFLKRHSFRLFPVNPRYATVLGEICRPYLRHVDQQVDIVDVFRRPEHLAGVLEDALHIGARVVWLQLGIVNYDFAHRAQEAGLEVVMDRCIKKEYERLILRRSVARKYNYAR